MVVGNLFQFHFYMLVKTNNKEGLMKHEPYSSSLFPTIGFGFIYLCSPSLCISFLVISIYVTLGYSSFFYNLQHKLKYLSLPVSPQVSIVHVHTMSINFPSPFVLKLCKSYSFSNIFISYFILQVLQHIHHNILISAMPNLSSCISLLCSKQSHTTWQNLLFYKFSFETPRYVSTT